MDKYTLNKDDSLILVIDIQERLKPAMEQGDRVEENTKILLEASKLMDIPVLITEQYPRGLGHTSKEILDVREDLEVFEKISFTGCIEAFNHRLKDLKRKKVIIVGMETHVCVLQTCRDLLADGYDVHIVRDGVTSRTKEK